MTQTVGKAWGDSAPDATVAAVLEPLLRRVFGGHDAPLDIRFWDGSMLAGTSASSTALVLHSPNALRRLLYAPGELGFGRAYVAGDIDVDGDIYELLDIRRLMGATQENVEVKLDPAGVMELAKAAKTLGVIGKPLGPPLEEAQLRGRRHSRQRDASAVAHHYNVGNDFYRLVLGESMVYSCAYWAGAASLEEAQTAKCELVSRKLGLTSNMRLLDVGCGWGTMAIHAASRFGVRVVGVTLAAEQAELARERVREAGMEHLVEIRYQDYRDVTDGPFDAISSIGMFEHVGSQQRDTYLKGLFGLLRPGGRLLNHAISAPNSRGGAVPPRSFVGRYVFPDGELMEVGKVVTAMQDLGFEVRDLESLREHYAQTLRVWVTNLESRWDDVVHLVGLGRARVWRLYMAASAVNFEANRTSIHQVLGVKPHADGRSSMPLSRGSFLATSN
jgi:cyclopropane-fatty-acyl-phospholipid synthase